MHVGFVPSARTGDFGIWEIVKIYVALAAKTLISLRFTTILLDFFRFLAVLGVPEATLYQHLTFYFSTRV